MSQLVRETSTGSFDLDRQNQFKNKLSKFFEKECGGRKYQAIIALEINEDRSFATTVTNLKKDSSFKSWRLLTSTLGFHFVRLAQNFQLGIKIDPPPVQPKLGGDP